LTKYWVKPNKETIKKHSFTSKTFGGGKYLKNDENKHLENSKNVTNEYHFITTKASEEEGILSLVTPYVTSTNGEDSEIGEVSERLQKMLKDKNCESNDKKTISEEGGNINLEDSVIPTTKRLNDFLNGTLYPQSENLLVVVQCSNRPQVAEIKHCGNFNIGTCDNLIHLLVVEPKNKEKFAKQHKDKAILVLSDDNRGIGFARNAVQKFLKDKCKWAWMLDDSFDKFYDTAFYKIEIGGKSVRTYDPIEAVAAMKAVNESLLSNEEIRKKISERVGIVGINKFKGGGTGNGETYQPLLPFQWDYASSCMLLNIDLLDRKNLFFNPSLPLYEDMELCTRMQFAGLISLDSIRYQHLKKQHLKGGCSDFKDTKSAAKPPAKVTVPVTKKGESSDSVSSSSSSDFDVNGKETKGAAKSTANCKDALDEIGKGLTDMSLNDMKV
jgi:hypothetical protein